VRSELDQTGLGVRNLGYGTKSHEDANLLCEVFLHFSQTVVHLSGTLGVPDEGDLLMPSERRDVINDSGQVESAHFLPVELPVLAVVRVQVRVLQTVSVSARVAKPHIVAIACGDKGRGVICIVRDPAVGGVEDTMLQEDGRFVGSFLAHQARDTEDGQDVTIVSHNGMLLILETILDADLSKVTLAVTDVSIQNTRIFIFLLGGNHFFFKCLVIGKQH